MTCLRQSLCHSPTSTDLYTDYTEKFAAHFIENIESIQAQISSVTRHLPTSNNKLDTFSQFQPTNIAAFVTIIQQIKSYTCILDTIPTKFFKEILPTVDLVAFITLLTALCHLACLPINHSTNTEKDKSRPTFTQQFQTNFQIIIFI